MSSKHETAIIALGANLPSQAGLPKETLHAALQQLSERGCAIRAVSRFFETPCFPAGAGPDYVNAAAAVRFSGEAHGLLEILHGIEADFARKRDKRWGQRTLDLDLIAFGSQVLPDQSTHEKWRSAPLEEQMQHAPETLILPHPRLQDRAFVLVPMNDIAPDWIHPLLGTSVAQMHAELPDEECDAVIPLG